MADSISRSLRNEIRSRANGRCEYCRIRESLLLTGCEVDHIVSQRRILLSRRDSPKIARGFNPG
jgi:hypothetical protein